MAAGFPASGREGSLLFHIAERQEGKDIGIGQGRVGTIGELQPVEGAGDIERQVIALHARLGLQVQVGLRPEGVGHVHVAAHQGVAVAPEDRFAAEEMDAPHLHGIGHGALQPEVDIAHQPQIGRLQLHRGSGSDANIQPNLGGDG